MFVLLFVERSSVESIHFTAFVYCALRSKGTYYIRSCGTRRKNIWKNIQQSAVPALWDRGTFLVGAYLFSPPPVLLACNTTDRLTALLSWSLPLTGVSIKDKYFTMWITIISFVPNLSGMIESWFSAVIWLVLIRTSVWNTMMHTLCNQYPRIMLWLTTIHLHLVYFSGSSAKNTGLEGWVLTRKLNMSGLE